MKNYLEIYFQWPVRWVFSLDHVAHNYFRLCTVEHHVVAHYYPNRNDLFIPHHKMNISEHIRLYEYFESVGIELRFIDYGNGRRGPIIIDGDIPI